MKLEKNYKHGYTTPNDYFDTFEDALYSKLEEDSLPKEHGFNIPEGYFNTMENEVFSKISEKPQKNSTKVISIFRKKSFLLTSSIAACLVVGLLLFKQSGNTTVPIELSEIEDYLFQNTVNINTYDIAQLLDEEDLNTITAQTVIFSEEYIEDYLLEHINDNTLLIE